MANVSVEVSVSNVMPPEITSPDPLLLRTAGTSLAGLRPTAEVVPVGDTSKSMTAAPAIMIEEKKAMEVVVADRIGRLNRRVDVCFMVQNWLSMGSEVFSPKAFNLMEISNLAKDFCCRDVQDGSWR